MKKILPVAVLAALAGVNAAQAVHVNPDGTGQVLVFPFYTVEGGQDTYINLVNTTDQFKAVKVRVLESMNSQEVLDFNLYLSPYDHWSAAISANAAGGASIQSNDNSCTVPLAVSQHAVIPFRDLQYQDDWKVAPQPPAAGVRWGVERTREGYLEVIEMGVITSESAYATAMLHNAAGVPKDCSVLSKAWASGGSWANTGGTDDVTVVGGGLYGYGIMIDVQGGTDAGYDAVAIDDWADTTGNGFFHSGPGDLLPSLVSGADLAYDVFYNGGVASGDAFNREDAVSVTFMQSAISNDYVLEQDVAAGTDWVVTFPTKRFYVNEVDGSGVPVIIPPFLSTWNRLTSTACEEFGIRYWNREENEGQVDEEDFSPQPEAGTFSFCYEANVLTFNESNVLSASARSGYNLTLDTGFENGWARIDFTGEGRDIETIDHEFFGLPVTGFAVQRYVNGTLPNGVLSNYAGDDLHKGERTITSGD